MSEEIRIKNCVKAPVKETLLAKLITICQSRGLNISWINVEKNQVPDKKWLVDVIGTLNPHDEIFKKDYVAPPTRKRLRDIETIVLPNDLFEDMPKSTSKVKARRLKIVSEAFAAEKSNRLKDMQKAIYEEIVTHEERLDDIKIMMRAK